jgi:hypothetical protein
LFCLIALPALGGCASTAAETPAAPTLSGALTLETPAAVRASAPVPVAILRADAPDGLAVTLAAQGSYGMRVYKGVFAKGRALITLPGEHTRQTGLITLIARAGTARGEGQVEIRPNPPADPVQPIVGPRSVAADGDHETMALAVPFDDYGNPVADGTPLTLRILHPGDQLEQQTLTVTHLLAWGWVNSRTRAGRAVVSAAVGDAHGPDTTFEEVPTWPASFGLSASPLNLPADGRQLLTLRTDLIRDRFGNPMIDGTLVTFVVEVAGSEPRFVPAYTVDGAAEAQLQAPTEPGTVTVRATLYGVESRPLTLSFAAGPAVGTIVVKAQVNARDGFVTLTAGPLLAALGQFVPDGTSVQFTLVGPDGAQQQLTALSETGRASLELRLSELPPGSYSVAVSAGAGQGQTEFVSP